MLVCEVLILMSLLLRQMRIMAGSRFLFSCSHKKRLIESYRQNLKKINEQHKDIYALKIRIADAKEHKQIIADSTVLWYFFVD